MNRPVQLVFAAASAMVFASSVGAAGFPNIDLNRAIGVIRDAGTAATGIPEDDEIALGRELAGRTMGAAPLVKDRRLQRYVNRVGRAIADQSDRPALPWRFGVIDTPSVNAFAAPGGVILITRGLYELLDNEAQLAAVLGHEVAHVMKRHHVEVMRKQAGTSALAGAAQTYVQARGRDRTGLFDRAIGSGAEIFARALDKSAEYEADEVGVSLAAKAGYNVSGMIDVLHKLEERAGDPSMNLLFETHPHPSERLTQLGQSIAPRIDTLAAGKEPRLQVAGSSLPPPVAAGRQGQPAARGRALANEARQTEELPPDFPLPGGLIGGGDGGAKPGDVGIDILRGILGR